ncbi:MAG: hypothetical protein NXI04_18780 [Planctomycetaceae bacterium]|nr:hypothetical protein [Planctomycetaceae bacterium]
MTLWTERITKLPPSFFPASNRESPQGNRLQFQWEACVDRSPVATCHELPPLRTDAPIIAFDLDETLLVNSWISPECFDKQPRAPLVSAWKPLSIYRVVSMLSRARGQRFIRPLLELNPTVLDVIRQTVQVRVRHCAVSVLNRLRSEGFALALVTASRRRRVDYLRRRLPGLMRLFTTANKELIACAEDLSASLRDMKTPSASLAHKFPDVVQRALRGASEFRLLVDDSKDTQRAFAASGLSGKLIHVHGHTAYDSHLMIDTLRRIHDRLGAEDAEPISNSAVQRELSREEEVIIEDPYYLPLLQRNLSLTG